MTLQKTTTSYGLDIYVDRVPGMKNVDAELVVKVGSVDEPAELAGICHALEHCTFLRTPSFIGTPAIDHFADRHAFSRNADTHYTRTNFYAKGLEVGPMFQLLGELVFNAEFRDDEVVNELKSVRREATTGIDDIDTMNFYFKDYAMFGNPYGRCIVGYHDKLEFPAAVLADFYAAHYVPQNMTLIVVGDVTLEQIGALAEKFAFRTGDPPPPVLPVPTRPHPDVSSYGYLREDSSNARVSLCVAMPSDFIDRYEAEDWAYAAAMDAISQAVFESLRYETGLSYDGSFGTARYNHKNAWRMRADVMVDTDKVDEAIAALRSVIDRHPDSYTDERLQETLASQLMIAAKDVDDPLGWTDTYVDMIAYDSPLISIRESYDRLQGVTLSDIRRALADIHDTWHAGDALEFVTGPKAAVGDRFVIEQSLFA